MMVFAQTVTYYDLVMWSCTSHTVCIIARLHTLSVGPEE